MLKQMLNEAISSFVKNQQTDRQTDIGAVALMLRKWRPHVSGQSAQSPSQVQVANSKCHCFFK